MFVLLDRDGTLNVDRDYIADPALLELVSGAAAALRRLRQAGCGLVVVTNQSAIGRGWITAVAVEQVNRRLAELLEAEGAALDAIYVCPHRPDEGCPCRKPRPGMVHRAAAALAFDPRRAYVVGDKSTDIELGRAVGATTILVRTGYGAATERGWQLAADHVADDIGAAADWILARLASHSRAGEPKA